MFSFRSLPLIVRKFPLLSWMEYQLQFYTVYYMIIARKYVFHNITGLTFLCLRHEMAEGHIEFTLCMCVFVYSRIVSGPQLSHSLWDLKIIWHKCSSWHDDVSQTRTMWLGQRSRSQSALILCAYTSVKPVCVRSITLLCMVGFKNNMAQMIILTRQYVPNKNHVPRSKVKVTVHTYTLCTDFSETCSCQTHNFVMHCGI